MDGGFLAGLSGHFAFERALMLDLPYEYLPRAQRGLGPGAEKRTVMFHPVPVSRIIEFQSAVSVLLVRQERARDKKLAKLPLLWFLCGAAGPGAEGFAPLLYALLELVCRTADIDARVSRKENGDMRRCNLYIDGTELNGNDFLEIRQIVLEQAGIDWDDSFVNEDAERGVSEGRAEEQRKAGYVPPSPEELIDIVSMYLHMGPGEVAERFTLRRFNNMIRHMSRFEDYKLLQGAALGGWVKFKDPVRHWVSGLDKKDMFADANRDYRNSDLFNI